MDFRKIEAEAAKAIANKLASLIDREFSRKVNPFDQPWALTKKDGRPFDIRDSIRSSIIVKVSGDRIEVDSTKLYTIFHQTGTSKMVQRMIFPEVFPNNFYNLKHNVHLHTIYTSLNP